MSDLSRRNFLAGASALAAASALSFAATSAFAAESSKTDATEEAATETESESEAAANGVVAPLADRKTLHGLSETDEFDPDQDVDDEIVDRIIRAALTAPSAVGAKSLDVVIVRDRATLQQIHTLSPNANQLETCPVALVLVEHATAEDAHARFFAYDAGLAAMGALAQATAEGLTTCVMEARLQDKDTQQDNDYSFIGCDGENYIPQLIIALGYPTVDSVAGASVDNYDPARIFEETVSE